MCGKAMRRKEGGRRIVLLIFVLYLLVGEGLWVGAESLILGQLKSYLFPAGIYADAISMIHSGYFYILFLWAIVVSDFPPLEIHKYLDLPLSSITFTANSQADNHFNKYNYLFLLFQVLYSNGLQKNLKMVCMVYFKWSTEKTLCRKKKIFFCRLCKN